MTRKPRSKLEFHNIERKLFRKHIKRKNNRKGASYLL